MVGGYPIARSPPGNIINHSHEPMVSVELLTLRSAGHEVEEVIELTGYEDNHRLFVVRAAEA